MGASDIIFLIFTLGLPFSGAAEIVEIPDADLRSLIQETLGKADGTRITEEEFLTLTVLHASPSKICGLI